jgi:hypothetical protein
VLLTAQTSTIDNGIYNASASSWARSGDFDGAYDVVNGTLVVQFPPPIPGTGAFYQLNGTNPITPGVTPISFVLISSPSAPYPQTQAEINAGINPTNTALPVENLLRYGLVPNSSGAAASNTAILKALFNWFVTNGPTGRFYLPNTTGTDIYYFNDYILLRAGIRLDLGGCTVNFTKVGVFADTNGGFLYATHDVTIENGKIVVSYTVGGGATNAGNAIAWGGRDVPTTGSPLPTIFDSLLSSPMGHLTLRNLHITSNVSTSGNGNGIFGLGGLQDVVIDNVTVDGTGNLNNGLYCEFGWATNESNEYQRQTSHPHNWRITNFKVSNLTTTLGSAIDMRGAYNIEIDGLKVSSAFQCVGLSAGESLYYRPWVGQDDIGSIGPNGRAFHLNNITGRAIGGYGVYVVGAFSAAGSYLNGHGPGVADETEQLYLDMQNIVLDGGAGSTSLGYGIRTSAGQFTLRNFKITNFQRGVVTEDECTHYAIKNGTILNCSSNGIQVGQATDIYSPARKSIGEIKGCFIAGSGTGGSGSAAIAMGNTASAMIVGNRFGYETGHDNISETVQTNAVNIGATCFGVVCDSNYVAATTAGAVAYTQVGSTGGQGCEIRRPLGNVLTSSGSWDRDGMAIDSATNIATKTAAINVQYKYLGRRCYDTSNKRIMVAQGPNNTDQWETADGLSSVTPS